MERTRAVLGRRSVRRKKKKGSGRAVKVGKRKNTANNTYGSKVALNALSCSSECTRSLPELFFRISTTQSGCTGESEHEEGSPGVDTW